MDYRHTEDFARRMEAAELRARRLRDEALDAWFAAIARGLRALARRALPMQNARGAGPRAFHASSTGSPRTRG